MTDFLQLADLASERLGGRVIAANDEFFAPKENLLKESKPVFIEGKYTARGKWVDGWETRRRRTPGHDWCVFRLGLPGIIRGIVVDTSFFTGNYPERFSLEGCDLGSLHPANGAERKLLSPITEWVPICPETALQGDSRNLFPIGSGSRFTHLRLRIYPDGGVARLRVHGEAVPDTKRITRGGIDLAAVENGGSIVASSDQFYGAPRNLLMPYKAKNMGDGWETKRRRGPGHDWVVLKLGVRGKIQRIVVDTAHFKGNFPDSCSLDACFAKKAPLDVASVALQNWQEILAKTKLKANHRHVFKVRRHSNAATHVRFQIYPDGGVSRLRIFGTPEIAEMSADGLAGYNRLPRRTAIKSLLDCCGCKKWADQLAALRPFATRSQLFETSDKIWNELSHDHWVEAFRHHPPIGGKQAAAKQSATANRWSSAEQSTAQVAAPALLTALAEGNRAYAAKFSYVFLICATGKTSEEILQAMQQRMSNNPETEMRVAAEEQRKITRLRLEKLLNS
jgi:allantoicase